MLLYLNQIAMGIFSQDSKRQKKNKRDSNIHETKKEIGSSENTPFITHYLHP